MPAEHHTFSDLESLIDRVHALFDDWEQHERFAPMLDMSDLHRLKLAVHEWLANLVQHASFNGHAPEVSLSLELRKEGVCCTIRDNSEGFNLDDELTVRSSSLESLPERGMGLLMLQACTKRLSYSRVNGSEQQLEFVVSTKDNPWLKIQFS